MLEELLKSREAIKNPNRGTAADGSGEIVYGTLEDVLPGIVNSLIQLPLVLSKLEKRLRKRQRKWLSNPGDEMLRVKDVAALLGCSYSEAWEKMKDGRIRTVKEGRWLRSRREWVEEYITKHTVTPMGSDPQIASVVVPPPKRKSGVRLKPGGAGLQFLQKRKKK
jgi:excisionase family DNA binding protein